MKYLIAAVFLICCVIVLLLPDKKGEADWSIDNGYPTTWKRTDSSYVMMWTMDNGLTWETKEFGK